MDNKTHYSLPPVEVRKELLAALVAAAKRGDLPTVRAIAVALALRGTR